MSKKDYSYFVNSGPDFSHSKLNSVAIDSYSDAVKYFDQLPGEQVKYVIKITWSKSGFDIVGKEVKKHNFVKHNLDFLRCFNILEEV